MSPRPTDGSDGLRAHHDYVYWVAEVVKVVDGDTVDLLLEPFDTRRPVFASAWFDNGFHVETRTAWFIVDGQMSIEPQSRMIHRVRLLGVDTPERGEAGYAEATEFTRQWLAGAAELRAETHKSDSFGRYLAEIFDHGSWSLGDALLDTGHAVPWSRRKDDLTEGGH